MDNRKALSPLLKSKAAKSIFASITSISAGFVTGCVIIMIVTAVDGKIGFKEGSDAIRLMLFGIFSRGRDASGALVFGLGSTNIGELLFKATPVIMTGLSVTFAFKTGLFNIGAAGQYLAGTAAVLITALSLPETIPSFIRWLCAFFCGMLSGALWGIIPGYMKARFKVNEVISCIMTNWIAANLVNNRVKPVILCPPQ